MPYIVVTGQLATTQLGNVEGTLIAGLSAPERDKLISEMDEKHSGSSKILGTGAVRIDGRGRVLHLLNVLHHEYGYHVISHSMAMTSSNQERMSWTLFRNPSSHKRSPITM